VEASVQLNVTAGDCPALDRSGDDVKVVVTLDQVTARR
jgi:hypothetical protein